MSAIDKAIERKIDDYHRRFFTPSPATIARWKRQEARRLDRKNQLPLPLEFPDEDLLPKGDSNKINQGG